MLIAGLALLVLVLVVVALVVFRDWRRMHRVTHDPVATLEGSGGTHLSRERLGL